MLNNDAGINIHTVLRSKSRVFSNLKWISNRSKLLEQTVFNNEYKIETHDVDSTFSPGVQRRTGTLGTKTKRSLHKMEKGGDEDNKVKNSNPEVISP